MGNIIENKESRKKGLEVWTEIVFKFAVHEFPVSIFTSMIPRSSISRPPLLHAEPDLSSWRGWRRDQSAEGIEDNADLLVVLLDLAFELTQLKRQLFVRQKKASQFHPPRRA